MDPRQRILNILQRKPVDRIPVDIWHTPEVETDLKNYCGASDDFEMWKKLVRSYKQNSIRIYSE
ncbi:MAG: hypothetical protein A2V64_07795 [Bacteroidetes bacterium RBG_13_43_22]|nr:MAG: hypothetical protein A2V64_07795 [Bacteroidetes bacterium RBG_13_43_22]